MGHMVGPHGMWKEQEASLRFTLPGSGTEGPTKQENFVLGSCGTDQVKGVLTLQGDALSQADVNLKMPRNNQLLHFAFREDKQWKLQQIQDARNHVSQAIYLLANRDESYQFRTGAEVLKLMDAVMLQLTRARNRLTTPATLTLPEIAASGLTRMFAPTLPSDLLVNVYINLNKLCLTVYQLHALQPNSTKNFRPAGGAVLHSPGAMFEWGTQRLEVSHVHKVESVIPWLNDALVFFTVSLQLCQQLKDKVGIWGQDRAGPHPEEASQSTGHSAPSFGVGVGMPRAPCVSPKHPLIRSSVYTLCAYQLGVGHDITRQHLSSSGHLALG
uniref:Protein rogdi homolog n=1 Tax=Capra hircus TaxID=9925 RepID=A0A8C2PAY2_CAPHI